MAVSSVIRTNWFSSEQFVLPSLCVLLRIYDPTKMVWLYRDSMCHKIWALICIRSVYFECEFHEFWTNVLPVILSIGFVLSSKGSGLPPPAQEATASGPCAWLLTLPCIILVLLLLCWGHIESSLSRLIVCSSVIAQCPSITKVYSKFYVFFPLSGSLSCYHMVTLIFIWSLTAVSESPPVLHLSNTQSLYFWLLRSLYWCLVWVCFGFL